MRDIAEDPDRPGSTEHPEVLAEGVRTYHLEFSRGRVSGGRVKEPRHFLVYRRRPDGLVEVARVLHDTRDLSRHLPPTYRAAK
jgi:toxin ParE1/3/4